MRLYQFLNRRLNGFCEHWTGWSWAVCCEISDLRGLPSQGGSVNSAGFEKIISTPALRLGSIFFPKALPVIPADQVRVLNKKPEKAPAEW